MLWMLAMLLPFSIPQNAHTHSARDKAVGPTAPRMVVPVGAVGGGPRGRPSLGLRDGHRPYRVYIGSGMVGISLCAATHKKILRLYFFAGRRARVGTSARHRAPPP